LRSLAGEDPGDARLRQAWLLGELGLADGDGVAAAVEPAGWADAVRQAGAVAAWTLAERNGAHAQVAAAFALRGVRRLLLW
jgi:hypothetical protein